MSKRYIVTESRGGGCGCGCIGLLFFLIFGSLILSILPYLMIFIVIAGIILALIYIPKIRDARQRQKEEAELDERERRLNLERRRKELERRERELHASDSEDWKDF